MGIYIPPSLIFLTQAVILVAQNSSFRVIVMLILILLLILAALFLGGSYFAYRIAFFSPKEDREKIPSTSGVEYDPYREVMRVIYHRLVDRPCEIVTIRSRDGLTLSGRYYHVKDGAPLDIGFHGYRSSPMTDFSGGSGISFEMEHNLLLVDQRAHGKSQGKTITFGILERYDCLDWIRFAIDRFGPKTEIILYGISMGAATVLMAAELDLPGNVRGIVADCPYSSPCAIIDLVSDRMRIPHKLSAPFISLGARLYGGFNLKQADPLRAVVNTQVPILLIHGEADSFVPCDMSREILDANPGKISRVTFPDADHGISYLVDTDRYAMTVKDFVRKVLS